MQCHYDYFRVVQGLRASSLQTARFKANIEAVKLDAHWRQMRLAKSDVIGLSLLKASSTSDRSTATSSPNAEVVVSNNAPHCLTLCRCIWIKRVKAVPRPSVWLLNEPVIM